MNANDYEVLCGNDYIQLRRNKTNDYYYVHEVRGDGKAVAVLGYRYVTNDDGEQSIQILTRYEKNPNHGNMMKRASLTGGIEEGQEPVDTAKMELEEEAGIVADTEQFIPVGVADTYKGADTKHFLYAINCTGNDELPAFPEGDGSDGEVGTYCKWEDMDHALETCSDPLMHMLVNMTFYTVWLNETGGVMYHDDDGGDE